tara:strand:+ start:192 stop:374 length:183 start_codon:yes stop_codon:yes gene_type:complete
MEYFLICIVVALCGWQSWQLGIREGAERAVKRLHQEKIISIKPNGDISPNLFWVEDKTES